MEVGSRLAAAGLVLGHGHLLVGAGLAIRLEPAEPGAERLLVTGAGQGSGAPPTDAIARPDAPRLLALGVVTVDLERAATALGGLVERLPDDELLGARAARPAEPHVVLLEPTTEGRVAAALARAGEGPAAIYLERGRDQPEEVAGLRDRGARMAVGDGPLGRQLLLIGGPRWGPHLVIVQGDRAG